ncbi:hypothetical protein HYC85_030604 [Camellia sinensis]|uniref:Uncharacterized protein n=1 Tax=Camellia sinensis TaxID=4442 RepID=A0A7J7G152_CAMSI|nr:hypothetical protein HYC85_030604 [Camellia sinensis]
MGASEPQSSQTREPTTSKLKRMIEDLQRIVTDLASGTLAPSSTTAHARSFTTKGSQSWDGLHLKKADPLTKWRRVALKAEGVNKEQVLAVVAKTVDDTFATQNESILNQGASREKGRCIRNVPFSYNPALGRDQQSRPAPANPFTGASSKNPQTSKYLPRGQRVFHALYMPLSKALQILVGQGHLKPLEPRPLPNPLPAMHDATQYCAFHQQTGHDTDSCVRLRHEIQNLIDNGVIPAPGPAKPIGT